MFGMPEPRTPAIITDEVIQFCKEISPHVTPCFLNITPEPGCKKQNCYENVEEKVKREKGKSVFGYQIWYIPGKFIEGEHHAVWESPAGELRCITPREDNEVRFLFLRDSQETCRDLPVPNIRKALNGSSIGIYLKEKHDKEFTMKKRYYDGKGFKIPAFEIMQSEMDGFEIVVRESQKAGHDLPRAFVELAKNARAMDKSVDPFSSVSTYRKPKNKDKNLPCHCGSGKKYKKCHYPF